MNFISNILDSVPVVGHAKGLIHYAVGDKDAGNKAMYKSTRTSTVIAGGVVGGVLGGPAGAAGGAMFSGTCTDAVASGVMKETQGTVKHLKIVADEAKDGRFPGIPLLSTGLHLGCDALGATGMGVMSTGLPLGGDALGGTGIEAFINSAVNSVTSIASSVGIVKQTVTMSFEDTAMLVIRETAEKVMEKAINETTEVVVGHACYVTGHALIEAVTDKAEEDAPQEMCERRGTERENNETGTNKEANGKKETSQKASQSRTNIGSESGSQPPTEMKDNKETLKNCDGRGTKKENNEKVSDKDTKNEKVTVQNNSQSRENTESKSDSQPLDENNENKETQRMETEREKNETGTNKETKGKIETSQKASQSRTNMGSESGSQPPTEMKDNKETLKNCDGRGTKKENNEKVSDKDTKNEKVTVQNNSQSRENTESKSDSQPLDENNENKETQRMETEREKNETAANKETKGKIETSQKASQSRTNMGSESGCQPPKENKDNRNIDSSTNPNTFSDFLELLKEILESNYRKKNGGKFYIVFENLTLGDKKSLEKLIKKLNYFGELETTLELVIQIFDQYFPSNFTFENFLSLMEFVKTYINNKIEEQNMISIGTEEGPSRITTITSDIHTARTIVNTFNNIRAEIESENSNSPVNPNFRDIFSAVYHYFKHRMVPGDGILTVQEYFDWTRDLLRRIRLLPEFDCRRKSTIVYELYVFAFRRRIKIVVRFISRRIEISSCYFVSTIFDRDEDGDIFINGVHRHRV